MPISKEENREKAEIEVEGAEPLYREIWIENQLQDEEGNEVGLKPDAQVEITVEAEPQETVPKKPSQSEELIEQSMPDQSRSRESPRRPVRVPEH